MSFLCAKFQKNDIPGLNRRMKMGQTVTSRETILQEYHDCVEPLMTYLPWMEQHSTEALSVLYKEQGISEHSLSFPVYEGTLMQFIREAGKSSLMDRNYRYVYSRNRLGSHEDERLLIENATWRTWDHLKGILSWYVLGGRTKAVLWTEGARANIYSLVLRKMQAIALALMGTQPHAGENDGSGQE